MMKRNRKKGQSLAEYALILVLVSVAAIAGLTALGNSANLAIDNVAKKINPAP